MLRINHVNFKLPSGQVLLDDINLNIAPGDFAIILGSNGSGKSTLIKLINRMYHHTQGDLLFDGKRIQAYRQDELSEKAITLNQSVSDSLFMDLTVEENGRLIDLKRQKSWANPREFGQQLFDYLQPFNPTLAENLKTPVNRLSGGQQQILAFALYLRHQPKLLLLDEHTSALDPKTADKVMQFTHKEIQKRGLTALMTTHNLDFAMNYGNRIIVIKDGKIDSEFNTEQKQQLDKLDLLEHCY